MSSSPESDDISGKIGARDDQATFRQRIFKPQALDLEQIALEQIRAISLSALMVKDVGNASEANSVFTALVMNLDQFVFNILTAEKHYSWDDYKKKRQAILDEWAKASTDKSPIEHARKLYGITIEVLAANRLFKVRRTAYFGMGWLKGHPRPDLAVLEKSEDTEGEVESELDDDPTTPSE